MDLPAFANRTPELVWERDGRTLTTRVGNIAFTARSPWYSPSWIVTGTSPLALPVDATVYIAKSGAAHGYWKNVAAMKDYFAHSDVPALMPVLVGDATERAIAAHDKPRSVMVEIEGPGETVELHIRERTIETTTKVAAGNERVIEDQLAIHRALAADHEQVIDAWRAAADELRGSVATTWPPVITVPRGFGSATIGLHWSPSTHVSARASIVLSADARGAKLWSLDREPQATPNTRMIAGHPFLVMGEIPIPMDQLARAIFRTGITSINVRRHVTVHIDRHAPDAAVLDDVLELLGALCGAASEPYR
ncbi:MAG TPA: hypothetical protein VIV11_33585 [Kofleriaceae bacterium]